MKNNQKYYTEKNAYGTIAENRNRTSYSQMRFQFY